MHLAIVSPYPPAITGIGQYGYHVSRALAKSGAFGRITLLTSQSAKSQVCQPPANVQVERIWQPDHVSAGPQLLVRLSQLQPDLVWFNLGTTVFGRSVLANISGLLCPAIVHGLGLPTVVTMHELPELADLRTLKAPGGLFSGAGAHWVTSALTQADVVCLTLKRYTDYLGRNRPGKRYVHIPIGLYHEPQIMPEPPAPELLFFSTLAPYKGIELLLQAFCSLRGRIPHLRLTIAGAEHARFPGYLSQLQQLYHALPGIRWLGHVPEENVRALYADSQVVVLPYSAATGSSSALYQAMLWGRSIVVADLPDLRAAVDEAGLSVSFYANGNLTALAQQIDRLVTSPELRRQQVAHNHLATRQLHPDEICRAYLQAFNLALTMHDAPAHIRLPSGMTTESA
jgi:glycosyltransferase involved in cell wall biosynthesis